MADIFSTVQVFFLHCQQQEGPLGTRRKSILFGVCPLYGAATKQSIFSLFSTPHQPTWQERLGSGTRGRMLCSAAGPCKGKLWSRAFFCFPALASLAVAAPLGQIMNGSCLGHLQFGGGGLPLSTGTLCSYNSDGRSPDLRTTEESFFKTLLIFLRNFDRYWMVFSGEVAHNVKGMDFQSGGLLGMLQPGAEHPKGKCSWEIFCNFRQSFVNPRTDRSRKRGETIGALGTEKTKWRKRK